MLVPFVPGMLRRKRSPRWTSTRRGIGWPSWTDPELILAYARAHERQVVVNRAGGVVARFAVFGWALAGGQLAATGLRGLYGRKRDQWWRRCRAGTRAAGWEARLWPRPGERGRELVGEGMEVVMATGLRE